jgi:hypothetical protein
LEKSFSQRLQLMPQEKSSQKDVEHAFACLRRQLLRDDALLCGYPLGFLLQDDNVVSPHQLLPTI